jgi:prolyl oligopeptidase
MFIVRRKDLRRTARARAPHRLRRLSVGDDARSSASIFPWLERGGVYAVANLRGGSEYGESWHEDGMRSRSRTSSTTSSPPPSIW